MNTLLIKKMGFDLEITGITENGEFVTNIVVDKKIVKTVKGVISSSIRDGKFIYVLKLSETVNINEQTKGKDMMIISDEEEKTLRSELKQFIQKQEIEYNKKYSNSKVIITFRDGRDVYVDADINVKKSGMFKFIENNIRNSIKRHLNNNNIIEEYTAETLDYDSYTKYQLTLKELYNLIKDIEDNVCKANDNKINELKKQAKETGNKVEYIRYIEDCNDENEACEVDTIIEYIMPDGSFVTERSHNW